MATSFWEKFKNIAGVAFGRKLFLKESSDLRTALTVNRVVCGGITSLPSSDLVKKSQNLSMNPTFYDVTPTLLSLPFQYNKNHWKCGHLFLLINYAQIVITSYLELAFRAAGILLTATAGKFIPREDDKTWLKAIKVTLSPLTLILGTAFWSLGQTFSFVADTVSHTRALIDSILQLPTLFTAKLFGVTEGIPSFRNTAKILGLSILKLLPAAAIIVAGIFTAGTLVPAAHTGSTLLANSIAIASTHVTPLAIAATTLIATAASVALVTASKLWSSLWTTIDKHYQERPKSEDKPPRQQVNGPILKGIPPFGIPVIPASTRDIAKAAHIPEGADLAPPAEGVENGQPSSHDSVATRTTTNTPTSEPEPRPGELRTRTDTIILK